MATVRLVESADTTIGYGYLTIKNISQYEIEEIIVRIVNKLNTDCVDEDGTAEWTIDDILKDLTDSGYEFYLLDSPHIYLIPS